MWRSLTGLRHWLGLDEEEECRFPSCRALIDVTSSETRSSSSDMFLVPPLTLTLPLRRCSSILSAQLIHLDFATAYTQPNTKTRGLV